MRACHGLLAAAAFASLASAVAAAPNPALQRVESDQRQREQDRDTALAQAQAARGQIGQLEAQLSALDAAERTGDRSVSDKRLKLAALNAREADLDARLGGQREQLARLLGALELLRRDPPPALLVDPRDVRDAVRAAILMRAITPQIETRVQTLKSDGDEIARLRRQVATASEDLFTAESDVADRRAGIERQIADQTDAAQRAQADADAAAQDIASLDARARALRGEPPDTAASAPAAALREPPDPEHGGTLVAPATGQPVIRFGQAQPDGGRSLGWTWRTAAGAAVAAPAQGLVDFAGPLKGWGMVMILRLGGGYHLVLAGLDATLAAPGQMVSAGQPIGRMGQDASPAPELYFEIRKNGAPVDPARWLKAQTAGQATR